MKKEIRLVDPERQICQVTSSDERWYCRTVMNPRTGLPDQVVWRPSMTWICGHYPKGKGFEMWLKKYGEASDEIRDMAGERGYKVHRAIASLNEGNEVGINDLFENDEGVTCPLTSEEYAAVLSYWEWWETVHDKVEILNYEYTLWPDAAACEQKYSIAAKYFDWAGTVDLKVLRKEDGKVGIIDMKTSSDIWPAHEMQVCGYQHGDGAEWAAILQLNYKRNKKQKWKFTMIDDKFHLFVASYVIWENEAAGIEPLQRDFPLKLKLKGVEPKEGGK